MHAGGHTGQELFGESLGRGLKPERIEAALALSGWVVGAQARNQREAHGMTEGSADGALEPTSTPPATNPYPTSTPRLSSSSRRLRS